MKKIFQSNVLCIQTGATVRHAKEIMKEHRIRHLPVIDENQQITSLISKHDFIDTDRFQDLPVDLFASRPLTCVTEDTPLRQVALIMLEKKISCVLMTDSNANLVGIITTDDLLFQLTELLKDEKESILEKFYKTDVIITAGEFFRKLSDIGI